jgi:hypothetical protein
MAAALQATTHGTQQGQMSPCAKTSVRLMPRYRPQKTGLLEASSLLYIAVSVSQALGANQIVAENQLAGAPRTETEAPAHAKGALRSVRVRSRILLSDQLGVKRSRA